VRPCEEAIQCRNWIGTETTHWRVGAQGITRSITMSQWRSSVWKKGSGTLALIVDALSQ
jgi:hypothetical protein